MALRAGLRPGDRPALLLVAVLLLMLGQWVVIAALLTIEALSTVAGIALLAVALQVCTQAFCDSCMIPELACHTHRHAGKFAFACYMRMQDCCRRMQATAGICAQAHFQCGVLHLLAASASEA